jgi:hypothetical protein
MCPQSVISCLYLLQLDLANAIKIVFASSPNLKDEGHLQRKPQEFLFRS